MARSTGRSAALVAAGIFLSRIAGLIRQRVFAHYLGLSDAADALTAAFRIPNMLQNLLGEGVLSASFVPVYARLISEDKQKEAGYLAGAVAGLLSLFVSILVAMGVAFAPILVDIIAPGFDGPKRDLTIALVRILFPATAVLALSAWCLGILNSHGRFFLSYVAPVAWNVVLIAVALAAGARMTADRLVVAVAWGAVGGSVLQLLVQLPSVLRLVGGLRLNVDAAQAGVRTVVTNFGPALMGRGVAQISAFVDVFIASPLGTGVVAAVSNAQMLYTLPVSLFGMSVSAAELPAMSSVQGTADERKSALRERLAAGQQRIAFFVVPCAVAFLALGQVLAAGIFQTGRFTASDSQFVWAILAGSAVGLLAATLSRLAASAFYAMGDTRTPLRCAATRLILSAALGIVGALYLPGALGIDRQWGAVALTAASGLGAWVELLLLKRRLTALIGPAGFAPWYLAKLWLAAGSGAAGALALLPVIEPWHPVLRMIAACLVFGVIYLGLTMLLRIPAAMVLMRRFRHE